VLACVRLSVSTMTPPKYDAFQGYGYYKTLTENPMLGVEPTGQLEAELCRISETKRYLLLKPRLLY